jgi:hypothetical protein
MWKEQFSNDLSTIYPQSFRKMHCGKKGPYMGSFLELPPYMGSKGVF